MKIKPVFIPFIWSSLIFLAGFGLLLMVLYREHAFIETSRIAVPSVSGSAGGVPGGAGLNNIAEAVTVNSTGLPVLYFIGTALLLGVILYFLPVSKLMILLRILFGLGFTWGIFMFSALFLHVVIAVIAAVIVGVAWFFFPKIWLHDLVLLITIVSLGAMFGTMFSPWTVLLIMLLIAIYDYVAVRFGYMQWMVKKLSDAETLPAFFIPYSLQKLNVSLRRDVVKSIFKEDENKLFSILGGGDLFFPLWLLAAVWFASGIEMTLIMAGFTMLGLIATYLIHFYVMKGKATPALPPLFAALLCGLLLIRFVVLG
jgi:presenilin-like A22 family membrane protease